MILFAGDSFSHYHATGTWTDILRINLQTGQWNHSLGGSSLYFAYRKLQERKDDIKSKKFKYIILTCTSPQRIPYCKDESASHYVGNPAPEKRYFTESFNIDIWHFGYFERFYDRNFHNFLYKKILEDIIDEFSPYCKLVLLPCFVESHVLVREVYNKKPNFLYLNFPLMMLYEEGYNEKNHFTPEVNDILGNVLSDGILKQDVGPMQISLNEIKDAMK